MTKINAVWMEFHISRQARDLYQFDQSLFSSNGNVIIANFHAARLFAQKMNTRRDLVNFPERTIQAGQVNALGLIDEILHMVIAQYRKEVNPGLLSDALTSLEEQLGSEAVQDALKKFVEQFPPLAVYRREVSGAEYLAGSTIDEDGRLVAHREIVLEELLMLWLSNQNPAFSPFYELFDDKLLERESAYRLLIASLVEHIEEDQPAFFEGQSLIAILRSPAINAPYSLEAQLAFLQVKVGAWI
jgi:hypothetical protein